MASINAFLFGISLNSTPAFITFSRLEIALFSHKALCNFADSRAASFTAFLFLSDKLLYTLSLIQTHSGIIKC